MGLPKKIPSGRPTTTDGRTSDEQKRVVLNRYRVEKKLGSGNFGTAYLVFDLKTADKDEFLKVLKQIPCGDLQPDETVDAMHEAKLLSKLSHDGIVKFHDSFIDGESFCIVTEYCEGGDLDDYIQRMRKRGQNIPEKQIMDWTVQLLVAVHYMHCRRVLHRDLKARNIFLRNNRIKIGDFGISRILMGTADMATTFTGTPYYMSPEVLKHEGYNSKSDVWSLGCIIYELCCHRHAFEGQGLMGVMFKIVEGECPKIGDKYSTNLQSLLEKPAASEVLKLPFVERHTRTMKASTDEPDSLDVEIEAQQIEQTLKKKYHKRDLEEERYKHLTPRERLRLKKQEEADKKAKEMAEASRINLQNNMTRKQLIQEHKQQQEPAPWSNATRREMTFVLPEEATLKPSSSFRPNAAPVIMEPESIDSEDSEEEVESTLVRQSTNQIPANTTYVLPTSRLGKSVSMDDRPITPMKNKMVYDVQHSTLDFKDGIPEDPKLADTYYSQFEEEFLQDQDSPPKSSTSPRTQNEPDELDKDEDSTDNSDLDVDNEQTVLGASRDEDALIRQMENQLQTSRQYKPGTHDEIRHDDTRLDKNEDTIALADDTVAGAFGPTARITKMKNLRRLCEQKLGDDTFQRAYNFLKQARYKDDGASSTVDETYIMNQLRQITSQVSDCFLVDQLLFLEIQASMEAKFS